MDNIRFEIYTKFDENLKNIWKEIEKEADIDVYQSFLFNKYFYESQNTKKLLPQIVCFKLNNNNIGVLPLVKKKNIITTMSLLTSEITDYNGPIFKKDFLHLWSKSFELFYDNAKFDVLNLKKIKENYIIKKKNTKFKFDQNYYYLNLLNLKLNFTSLKKKKIKEVSNKNIYLKKNFILKEELDDQINFEDTINKIFILKKKQFKRTGTKDIFNYSFYEFLKKIYFLKDSEFQLKLSYLEIDKNIISGHIGLLFRNKFYYLFPTYDTDYKKHMPGFILLDKLIKKSIKDNNLIFDFGIGDEIYKTYYNSNSSKVYYLYFSKSILGNIFKTLDYVLLVIKKNFKMRKYLMKINKFYKLIKS